MGDKDLPGTAPSRPAAAGLPLTLENFKVALDQHVIVSVTDAAGRIVEANELFSTISGYSRDELIGQDHRLLSSGRI